MTKNNLMIQEIYSNSVSIIRTERFSIYNAVKNSLTKPYA